MSTRSEATPSLLPLRSSREPMPQRRKCLAGLYLLAVLTGCGSTTTPARVTVRAEPSVSTTTISTTNSRDHMTTTTTSTTLPPEFGQWITGLAATQWIGAVAANKRAETAGGSRDTHVTTRPAVSAPPSGPEGVPGGTGGAAPSGPGRRRVTAVIPDELVPFFECVIDHESGSAGVYTAVQRPSGKYRGAYQADRQFFESYAPVTWVVNGITYMRVQYVDPPAWEQTPPEVQDQMALNGYRARGPSPWMGICTRYAR